MFTVTTLLLFNVIRPVPPDVVSGGTAGSNDANCNPLVPLNIIPIPAPVLRVAVVAAPEHLKVWLLASVSVLLRPETSNTAPPAMSINVELGNAPTAFRDSVPLRTVVGPLNVLFAVKINLPAVPGNASTERPLPAAPEITPPKV